MGKGGRRIGGGRGGKIAAKVNCVLLKQTSMGTQKITCWHVPRDLLEPKQSALLLRVGSLLDQAGLKQQAIAMSFSTTPSHIHTLICKPDTN